MSQRQTCKTMALWFTRGVILAAVVALSAASLAPLLETNAWWVRVFDFPRAQMLVALGVIGLVGFILRPGRSAVLGAAALLWTAAAAYNLYKTVPFLPFAGIQTVAAESCPAEARIRILVANVERGNENAEPLFELVRSSQPDLFLAMETDQWWDEKLDQLQPLFRTHVKQIADARSHFGIHLFSQLAIEDGEVKFLLDNSVPSIFATASLPNGETIDFYGLHPTPPRLYESSRDRDAQLLLAAFAARDSANPVIVGGDLNAVPWERTFGRMLRIGGLLDPRLGRGFYNTYHAQRWAMAWPLDHILWQDQFALVSMRRMPGIGSDHYPWLAEVCHDPQVAQRQSAPALQSSDIEEARNAIAAVEARSQ